MTFGNARCCCLCWSDEIMSVRQPANEVSCCLVGHRGVLVFWPIHLAEKCLVKCVYRIGARLESEA